jgi:hypothetical protein
MCSCPSPASSSHYGEAYWLEEYRDSNQPTIERQFLLYRVAALAVLAQVLLWSTDLALL